MLEERADWELLDQLKPRSRDLILPTTGPSAVATASTEGLGGFYFKRLLQVAPALPEVQQL